VNTRLVVETLGITEANAGIAINRLVEAEVLTQIGNSARNRVWQAKEILSAMDSFADRSHHRGI
jgi:hypothetical protein